MYFTPWKTHLLKQKIFLMDTRQFWIFFKINSRSEEHDFWLEKNKRKFLPTIIKFITLITFEGNFDFPVQIWRNRRKRGDPVEKFTEQLVCLIVVAIEWNRRRRVGYKQDFAIESYLYLGNRERETGVADNFFEHAWNKKKRVLL